MSIDLSAASASSRGPAAVKAMAEQIVARWGEINDRSTEIVPASGGDQGRIELSKANSNPG